LGHTVVLVDLTRGESSTNGTPEEREQEAAEAARILGCRTRDNLGLPDTGLMSEDSDQQRRVVSAIRRHRPRLIILPLKDDPHPDHSAGGELIERAIYLAGVQGYRTGNSDSRWVAGNGLIYPGRRELEPDLVVDVSDTFQIKMDAIRAHRSQFDAHAGAEETPLNRPGFLPAIEARMVVAGHRVGVQYGEPFRTFRPLVLEDLSVFE
jgi:bacillithiol biosynthesis deacetylase BshB1